MFVPENQAKLMVVLSLKSSQQIPENQGFFYNHHYCCLVIHLFTGKEEALYLRKVHDFPVLTF